MMKTIFTIAAALGCSLLAGAPVTAATVDFANIKGEWFDAVSTGGPAPAYTGNGTANASVRWGNDTGNGQSGYDFAAIGIPQLTVTPPGGSAVTSIAKFTHVNQPITGGSISEIKLRFTTDILVDGSFLDTVSFVYDFSHDETNNGADPCAYGGANGQGVNINGCADRVLTVFNSQSDFFTVGGFDYALDVVGFLVGGSPATSFLTQEQANNEAFLQGRLVLYSEAGVPEPATWAMLIAGFGMVGFAARRRREATLVSA